jgi:hypothetical protein
MNLSDLDGLAANGSGIGPVLDRFVGSSAAPVKAAAGFGRLNRLARHSDKAPLAPSREKSGEYSLFSYFRSAAWPCEPTR